MKASRLLAVPIALAGLLLVVLFGLRPLLERGGRPQAPGAAPTPLEPGGDAGTPAAPAPEPGGIARDSERGAVGALAAAGPLRPLVVTVAAPAGSPPEPELAVVAVSSAFAADSDLEAVLERVRAGSARPDSAARAAVGPSGTATLQVPAAISDPVVVLDSRFLILDAPVPVPEEAEHLRLEPRLGACLVIALDNSTTTPARGELRVSGLDFSGRGRGFSTRSLPVAGQTEIVCRGLDPRLTWSILPVLESHAAELHWGLELEPGEERRYEIEVRAGATLTGRVVGPGGGGLAGIEVRTAGGNPWMQGADVRSTESAEGGRFELAGVRPGTVRLEARGDGWRTASSEALEAPDGARVEGVVLALDRGLAILGRVTHPDGSPAAGALVRAESSRSRPGFGNWGGPRVAEAGRTQSGEDGAFAITGLDEDAYTLRAELESGGALPWRAALPSVRAGQDDVLLELAGPVPFSGRVVDDRGEALPSFRIEVRSSDDGGPREEQDFADPEGRFRFERAGPGDWRVTAVAEGHRQREPLALALPTQEEPVELVLLRLCRVSGVVVDATGAPVRGASVVADDGTAPANPWGGRRGPRVETAQDGTFDLDDLDPGAVALVAQADGWADSEPLALELSPGQRLEGQTLALRLGGRIEGGVVTHDGQPLAGRRVTWGESSMGFGARGDTRTDESGRFSFEHVTPGRWAVTATPGFEELAERMRGRDPQTAWVEVMGQMESETVDVQDGQVTEVWLGGEPRVPVRVFGTVTMGGQPLAGARVTAVSEGSAIFEGMKAAQSQDDGAYELVVDRPGAYVVSAASGRAGVEAYVDVPRARETRVDLAIPRGRIEGRVEKPGGRPAAGVRLSLQRTDGLGRMRWGGDQATTDTDGRYSFEGLEAGLYTVRANVATWSGRADEDFGAAVRKGVRVRADQTAAGIDLDLEPAGTVEGTVLGAGGQPAAGVTVFFRTADGTPVTRVSSTVTDSSGRFHRAGLAPGTYTVSARSDGLASTEESSVAVRSGETTETRLTVDDGVWVVVRIEDPEGEAQRARVEVLDASGVDVGSLITLQALQAAFNEGFSSSEQRVGPLPAGRYTVRATLADGTARERRVTLRAGQGERVVKLRLD